jgi:hypothetical protein
VADETAEIAALQLAAEEDVGGDIEIVGEREILIDRLDAGAARIDGLGRSSACCPRTRFAGVLLVDARHALDECRLARAVVAQQRDDLALVHVEADIVYGGQAAEALDHVLELKDRLAHDAPPLPRPRPMIRSRD